MGCSHCVREFHCSAVNMHCCNLWFNPIQEDGVRALCEGILLIPQRICLPSLWILTLLILPQIQGFLSLKNVWSQVLLDALSGGFTQNWEAGEGLLEMPHLDDHHPTACTTPITSQGPSAKIGETAASRGELRKMLSTIKKKLHLSGVLPVKLGKIDMYINLWLNVGKRKLEKLQPSGVSWERIQMVFNAICQVPKGLTAALHPIPCSFTY